jgi:hypothetical protein
MKVNEIKTQTHINKKGEFMVGLNQVLAIEHIHWSDFRPVLRKKKSLASDCLGFLYAGIFSVAIWSLLFFFLY